MEPLLKMGGLTLELPTAQGWVRPVNDVSLRIHAGECLGLVGESGRGKTMLSLALMLPTGGRVKGRLAAAEQILHEPREEYTKELLAAVPAH
jgi:ABC-type glutathione transport system ATPase component